LSRKHYNRASSYSHIFTGFGGGFWSNIFEMKKPKQKARQRRRKPNASQLKRQRNKVLDLTTQGKNRAVVAATLGVGVNRLREDFALELDAGRMQAKEAARADEADAALSQSQYHFRAAAESFDEGSWIDTDGTNLLFRGVGGNGAKDLADAYAFWASNGERFNTTGLSTR
jgi:hypothetical protein